MLDLEKTPLAKVAEEEIQEKGLIPFSRYMELWLQGTPQTPGYYQQSVEIGGFVSGSYFDRMQAPNDFTTSPEMTQTFGFLLAKQLTEMRYLMPNSSQFNVVEMGAGNGTLARAIIYGLQIYHPRFFSLFSVMFGDKTGVDSLPEIIRNCQQVDPSFEPLFKRPPIVPKYLEGLTYTIIESSDRLIWRQRKNLEGLPVVFLHSDATSEIANFPSEGVVITNELVDAFPVELVRRGRRGQRNLEQCFVEDGGNSFKEVWQKLDPQVADFLGRYYPRVPSGKILPVNLASVRWLEGINKKLDAGYIVTIDYGGTTDEITKREPIRRYSSWMDMLEADMYSKKAVGLTDMTAYVNFEVLMKAGEEMGLKTVAYLNQREFLHNLGIDYQDPFVWYFRSNAHQFMQPPSEPFFTHRLILEMNMPSTLQRDMGDLKVLIQSKNVTSDRPLAGAISRFHSNTF